MELSGFRVSIHSDDEELKEYSIEVSADGKKATCWVPSQSGKEFIVKYWVGELSVMEGKEKSVHVYIDGRRMVKYAPRPREARGEVGGVSTSANTWRPFKFADIQTTDYPDEDVVPSDLHVKPDEIGTICVRVFLVKNRQYIADSPRKFRIQDHPPAVIDERAKKASDHCVSLGDEQPRKTAAMGNYYSVYDSRKPDLVFEFRYHSTAMLQALGIIPPPKREALSIIDLEDEDILPHPKRQKTAHNGGITQSMQAELERLRRRVDELEGGKAGPSSVKKEVIKHDPADIIDLT